MNSQQHEVVLPVLMSVVLGGCQLLMPRRSLLRAHWWGESELVLFLFWFSLFKPVFFSFFFLLLFTSQKSTPLFSCSCLFRFLFALSTFLCVWKHILSICSTYFALPLMKLFTWMSPTCNYTNLCFPLWWSHCSCTHINSCLPIPSKNIYVFVTCTVSVYPYSDRSQ